MGSQKFVDEFFTQIFLSNPRGVGFLGIQKGEVDGNTPTCSSKGNGLCFFWAGNKKALTQKVWAFEEFLCCVKCLRGVKGCKLVDETPMSLRSSFRLRSWFGTKKNHWMLVPCDFCQITFGHINNVKIVIYHASKTQVIQHSNLELSPFCPVRNTSYAYPFIAGILFQKTQVFWGPTTKASTQTTVSSTVGIRIWSTCRPFVLGWYWSTSFSREAGKQETSTKAKS